MFGSRPVSVFLDCALPRPVVAYGRILEANAAHEDVPGAEELVPALKRRALCADVEVRHSAPFHFAGVGFVGERALLPVPDQCISSHISRRPNQIWLKVRYDSFY